MSPLPRAITIKDVQKVTSRCIWIHGFREMRALTFFYTILSFDSHGEDDFENIVRKKNKNAGTQHFLIFPTISLPLPGRGLSSANGLNFDKAKILSFGEESKLTSRQLFFCLFIQDLSIRMQHNV